MTSLITYQLVIATTVCSSWQHTIVWDQTVQQFGRYWSHSHFWGFKHCDLDLEDSKTQTFDITLRLEVEKMYRHTQFCYLRLNVSEDIMDKHSKCLWRFTPCDLDLAIRPPNFLQVDLSANDTPAYHIGINLVCWCNTTRWNFITKNLTVSKK